MPITNTLGGAIPVSVGLRRVKRLRTVAILFYLLGAGLVAGSAAAQTLPQGYEVELISAHRIASSRVIIGDLIEDLHETTAFGFWQSHPQPNETNWQSSTVEADQLSGTLAYSEIPVGADGLAWVRYWVTFSVSRRHGYALEADISRSGGTTGIRPTLELSSANGVVFHRSPGDGTLREVFVLEPGIEYTLRIDGLAIAAAVSPTFTNVDFALVAAPSVPTLGPIGSSVLLALLAGSPSLMASRRRES